MMLRHVKLFAGLLAPLTLGVFAAPVQAMPPAVRTAVLTSNPCDAAGNALTVAMTTQPMAVRKVLICSMIRALESAGAFQACDAGHIYAAASAQAALLNVLKPGTMDATNSGATFVVDRGLNGDGASTFADTHVNPTTTTHLSQNSAFMGVWSLTQASTGSTAPLGWAVSGVGGIYLIPRNSTNFQAIDNNNTTGFGTSPNSDGRGWFTVNRSNSAGFDLGAQGVFLTTITAASVATINHNIQVDNFAAASFSSAQVAADMFCNSLTAGQQAGIYTALHPYLQMVAGVP